MTDENSRVNSQAEWSKAESARRAARALVLDAASIAEELERVEALFAVVSVLLSSHGVAAAKR